MWGLEDLTRGGGATFLKKPFGRSSLSQAVARALGQHAGAKVPQ